MPWRSARSARTGERPSIHRDKVLAPRRPNPTFVLHAEAVRLKRSPFRPANATHRPSATASFAGYGSRAIFPLIYNAMRIEFLPASVTPSRAGHAGGGAR